MINIIRALFLVGWRIILAYFVWLRKYAKKGKEIPIKEKYDRLRNLVIHLNKGLKGKITVIGKENLPSGTKCFISNHINVSDPILLIDSLEEPMTFVCKKEIEKLPFAAKAVKTIEGEFIDRENLKEGLRTMMRVEASLKNHEKNWLIFVEGTRNRDPRRLLLDFHPGSFRAPMRAGVPIIPCAIYGSQRYINTHINLKSYPLYVEFGKPLMPEEYKEMSNQEVATIIKSRIQQMISYNARTHDKNELVKILGDKYNENL